MASQLPANVHISQHPSLQAKISQLRSKTASSRETNALVHEISLILACEALSKSLTAVPGAKVCCPSDACLSPHFRPRDKMTDSAVQYSHVLRDYLQDETPIGFEYQTTDVSPSTVCIVPILRSGLAMVEGSSFLPHHLLTDCLFFFFFGFCFY